MYGLTALPFSFKRAIAHGLWTVGLCVVAKLKVELRPPSTPPAGGAPPSDEAP